jgi:hypothetical protein
MQNKPNHIDILSSLRGLRNGIITGIRIRLPYVFQGIIYAILFRNQAYVVFMKVTENYEQIHKQTID